MNKNTCSENCALPYPISLLPNTRIKSKYNKPDAGYSRLSIILLTLLLVTGCVANSNKRPKEIITESFITDIKEDGTKLFIYVANFRAPKISRPKQAPGQGRNGQQQQPVQSMSSIRSDIALRQEEIAFEALERKLSINKYCRAGYFVLGNYNQFGSIEIRAECQDSATDVDRRLFQ
jgi:hypothetical protein